MEISSGVIFILGLLVFLFGFGVIITMLLIALRDIAKLSEINNRTFKMEHMLGQISTNMQLGQMENSMNEVLKEKGSDGHTTYRSADGKHQADSVEELLMKIASDPGTGVDPGDLEALKRIFEQIGKDIEDDDDDDEPQ